MSSKHVTQLRARVDLAESQNGEFSGVAVPYGVQIDTFPGSVAVLKEGVFARQVKDPARVKILWQHDHANPIGRATSLTESKSGLLIEGRITTAVEVPDAARALALLRDGIIDEMSIGFEWQKWDESHDGDLQVITHERARLTEVSMVTRGAAGRGARVRSVHSVDGVSRVDFWRQSFGL